MMVDPPDDYDQDEVKRLKAEVRNGEVALRIACENIALLNTRANALMKCLEGALALTDAMMTELRQLKGPPPISVIVAKSNFDKSMKKLLGEASTNQRRG